MLSDLGRVLAHFSIEERDLNIVDKSGKTPLQSASKAGRISTVRYLLSYGADKLLGGRTIDGLTPLHLSCVRAYPDFSNTIASHLKQGLDIDARDKLGKTPLHYAIELGISTRVGLLLDSGADASAADHDGKNCLYRAIQSCTLDIIKLILDHGVDATARFFDGTTPMHLASHPELYSLLANDYYLDIDMLDANGNTPLYVAMSKSDFRLSQTLIDCGANFDQLYWIDKGILQCGGPDISRVTNQLSSRLIEIGLPTTCQSDLHETRMEFAEEVARLKRSKISGLMTHYEFLHNADPFIARAICDADFDIDGLPAGFPHYGNLIKGKVKMDLFRLDLLRSAAEPMSSLLNQSPDLSRLNIPPEVATRILIHLSKNELLRLIRGPQNGTVRYFHKSAHTSQIECQQIQRAVSPKVSGPKRFIKWVFDRLSLDANRPFEKSSLGFRSGHNSKF